MRLEDERTHHWRQRERDEGRDRNRTGKRHRQFTEQTSVRAFDKGNRYEYRNQYGRRGDNGESYLFGAALCREQRRLAQIDTTLAVFQHHDGVIHHQTDRQNQGEQCQQIDRITECPESDKRGDQTHRHRHGWHQCRAHAAQEQPDHQQHQNHRFKQCCVNLIHRIVDEDGGIKGQSHFHVSGQPLVDRFYFGLDRIGNIQRIGRRCFDNAQTNLQLAIAAKPGAAVAGFFRYLGDIAKQNAFITVIFQHQILKIIWTVISAPDPQNKIAGLRLKATGRQFDVFTPQCTFNIGDGQISRGKRLRIERDTQGKALSTSDAYLCDAGQTGKTINQITFGIIGEFKCVALGRSEIQPHDHIGIGRLLVDLWRIGFFRQTIDHAADGIAHVIGGRFNFALLVEFNRDAGAAIA